MLSQLRTGPWVQHFAGVERGSRFSQVALNIRCERMCATQTAPRGPFRVPEQRHGLAEIIDIAGPWEAWY